MIKINLLPPEIIAEEIRQARQARFTRLTVTAFIVLVACFVSLFAVTLHIKGRSNALANERKVLEEEIAEYKPYVKLQSGIASKSKIVKEAVKAPPAWQDILVAMGTEIPSNVWMTDTTMNFNIEDDEGQANIRGLTYNHPSTARWLEAVMGYTQFDDVRCVFSAAETVDNRNLIRFEIKAKLLPGLQYDPLAKRGE